MGNSPDPFDEGPGAGVDRTTRNVLVKSALESADAVTDDSFSPEGNAVSGTTETLQRSDEVRPPQGTSDPRAADVKTISTVESAPRPSFGDRVVAALTAFWVNLWGPTLGALWGISKVRTAFRGTLPSGSDMPYHFARVNFGTNEIFSKFALDGWMPNHGQGSQAFLLYGSGTSIHFALIRALTFGLLGPAAAFQVLVAASLVMPGFALVFLGRSAGFSRIASNIAGLLLLTVSVTAGLGFVGLYSTGLLPHQIAATYWLLALGFVCKLMRVPTWRNATGLAVTTAALAFLHPTSMWILAIMALCLLCVNICFGSNLINAKFGTMLVGSGALWLILAAGWWIPLQSENEPRQGLASWGVEPIRKQLGDIINGRTVFKPFVAGVVVVCFFVMVVAALKRSATIPRYAAALPISGLAALAVMHFMFAKKPGLITMLLPVRSAGNIALLMLLPVGWAFHELGRHLAPKRAVFVAAAFAVPALVGPYQQTDSEVMKGHAARVVDPRLVQTAKALNRLVPKHGRWSMIVDWPDEKQYGVDLPQFWLTAMSKRNTLNGFGGDSVMAWNVWAPDSFLTLPDAELAMWLRRAGVTHVLAPGAKSTAKLTAAPSLFVPVNEPGALSLFAVKSVDGATAGQTQLVDVQGRTIALQKFARESISWTVADSPTVTPVVLAVGYTPKWNATFNGKSLTTVSKDGQIQVELPPGAGKLQLRYQIPVRDRLAGFITVGSFLTIFVISLLQWKRRRSQGMSGKSSHDAEQFAMENRDDWNAIWGTIGEDMSNNPAQSYRRRLVLGKVKRLAPKSIIDIGCGQGELLEDLHKVMPNAQLSGIDLSDQAIAAISRRMPGVHAMAVDLTASEGLPTRMRGVADLGICTEVIEHVEDPAALLRAAKHAVSPGGTMLITVPAGPRNQFEKHIGHRQHFTRASLKKVAEDAGLTDVRVEAAGFPFFNAYKLVGFITGPMIVKSLQRGKSIEGSAGGQLAYKIFDKAFRFNLPSSPFGWQLVALATVPKTMTNHDSDRSLHADDSQSTQQPAPGSVDDGSNDLFDDEMFAPRDHQLQPTAP
jgi:2-polyprenyl-3-methyl-5-hydroxy-6-metoxy-1,4-benzoquinol methylase